MNKTHISLNVKNIEKSKLFYESFLESSPHKVRPGYANFDLNNPPLKLAIQERDSLEKGQGNVSHFGIQVSNTDAVEKAIARLKNSGFETKVEKDEVCCYAKQDKVWVQDPDGNRWEVYTVTDEMESVESASCAPKENAPSCC
jgi:catechol 2,3-dioxygenase-like lactoylglutathione lyase family enzyme